MFEMLEGLWKQGRLPEVGLDRAIEKGWITEEQKLIIIEQTPAQ